MRVRPSFPGIVLLSGLITGTLGILAAIVQYRIMFPGQQISRLFAYIGSGVFGKAAFSGDPAMAWYGLLFHYVIALLFSLLFFLLYPKIPVLRKYPVTTGLGYGLLVWCIMQAIVLPLSNVPHGPLHLVNSMIGILILILMIGLPVSFIARRYYAEF